MQGNRVLLESLYECQFQNIKISLVFESDTHIEIQAKLEATNKLIKDIKRLGFGFRNFINFKKRVFITLNIKKEKTYQVLSRC